jgi:predicted nucleotide-binding protein
MDASARAREAQEKRQRFLLRLYEKSERQINLLLDLVELGEEVGLSPDEARQVAIYCYKQGWVRHNQVVINITTEGIDFVETQLLHEDDASEAIMQETRTTTPDPKRVFVIYGRNDKAFEAMKQFLRALGLKPYDFNELAAEQGGSAFVGDIVLEGMKRSKAVIAMFTPDEKAELLPDFSGPHDAAHDLSRRQARPNVIFEAGLALGHDAKKTIIVTLGSDVKLFSDVDGRHIVRLTNSPGARDAIRLRLKHLGCAVEESGDWHSAGAAERIQGEAEDAAHRRRQVRQRLRQRDEDRIARSPGVGLNVWMSKQVFCARPQRGGEHREPEHEAVQPWVVVYAPPRAVAARRRCSARRRRPAITPTRASIDKRSRPCCGGVAGSLATPTEPVAALQHSPAPACRLGSQRVSVQVPLAVAQHWLRRQSVVSPQLCVHNPSTQAPHGHCDEVTHCTQLPPLQKYPGWHACAQACWPTQVWVPGSQVPVPQLASVRHCPQVDLVASLSGVRQNGLSLGLATGLPSLPTV